MPDLSVLIQALSFGLAVAFMVIGLLGIVVPILPGILIIWLTVLAYAIVEGFTTIDWITFAFITLVALVSGTADLWMSYFGAKRGGASGRSIVLGAVGAVVGFIVLSPLIPIIGSIVGGVIGYVIGVLLGQYHKHRDWNLALKAGLGGLAGWGVATGIQVAGGLMILVVFVWQVLKN